MATDHEATTGTRLQEGFVRLDARFIGFMRAWGLLILRVSLGVVFAWFGLLKVFGVSPVEDLVAATVYWFPSEVMVPALGLWETTVGVLLVWGRAPRVTLALFWALLAGTFLVLLLRPDIAFQGPNPLLLSTEGEFVVKNLVLVSAGLVLGGTVRRRTVAEKREEGAEEGKRRHPTRAGQGRPASRSRPRQAP